ncbi:hypothetical protein BDB01DRAFT_847695 [Pilobolus umbonatus]|nr:hypothetical protein BDB01DRAFT_847695 [Pilobolus umbonatus]
MRLVCYLFISLLITYVYGLRLEGSIIPNAIIQDINTINTATTKAVLNGHEYTAYIQSNGLFVFPDVKPGSYLLEIQSIDHIYPKLRVDITEENEITGAYTALGVDWNQKGYSVNYPFQIQAKAEAEYFMKRQGLSLMGLVKNPMVLMIAFSGAMLIFMPRMLQAAKEMDPEEFESSQKMLADIPGLSQMMGRTQASSSN